LNAPVPGHAPPGIRKAREAFVVGAKAYLGRFRSDLEPAFIEAVSAARRSDPFAPLTVLVGSNLLGAYLRKTLVEAVGGLFNVRFLTFTDTVSTIAGSASRRSTGLMPNRADRVIAGDLLSRGDCPAIFGEAARARGFADALLATFADLAEAGCSPEIARSLAARSGTKGVGERTSGVLSLYGRFRDEVEKLGGDVHSLFREALAGGPLPFAGTSILAYGFYDFNEMQWRLLRRCAAESDLSLFMPWSDGEAYRFCEGMKAKLERHGFETAVLSRAGGNPSAAPRVRLLSVPGEEEEVREIGRRILVLAREEGVRFGDMAVLVPAMETYEPLVREAFGEARIPFFLRPGASGRPTAAARGALGALTLLGERMERRNLVEFIVSAPLRPREGEAPGGVGDAGFDELAWWARRSAETGMRGDAGWVKESAAFVERVARDAADGAEGSERLTAARRVDDLIRKIEAARERVRGASSWTSLAAIFSGLLRGLFLATEELEDVCALIEGLADLDRVSGGTAFETFSRIVESELEGLPLPAGRFAGEGVNILSFGQARGLTFAAVFIPGLAEGIYPTIVRQDPLLSDAERGEIGRLTGGAVSLSYRAERMSEEALLFAMAFESGRERVVLSYPRLEDGTGKERISSSFLRYVDGYSPGGTEEGLREERVSRGPSSSPGALLLSEHEFDLAQALGYANRSGILPTSVFFDRGARLVAERWGARRFTGYDGVLSSREALGAMGAMLDEAGWRFAPTALEEYARCPYEYFLRRVLDIEIVEEPDRIIAIAPLQRGRLIHMVLARLFGRLKEEGFLPLHRAPEARVFEIAEAVLAEVFGEFSSVEPVGVRVFWEMEKRLARESVRLLLEEERLERCDMMPLYFEKSFGVNREEAGVSLEAAGREIFFRGRIDRIDVDGRRSFRVIDYKTGRLFGADQDLAGGTALQLPVYLLAAAGILDMPLGRGTALYRHVGRGNGRRTIAFSGARWAETASAFATAVDVIVRGIEGGLFFAPADDQQCRNCLVRAACPTGMQRLFARKAVNDERVKPYLEMTSCGEEVGR
jgi:ATP-dependent helicase/nuclease subunit B